MRTGVYIMSLAEAIKIHILILMKENNFLNTILRLLAESAIAL